MCFFSSFKDCKNCLLLQRNTRNEVQGDNKIFSPKVNWFELGLGRAAGVIIKAIGLTKGINEFEGTMNRIKFFVAEHLALSIWFTSYLMERIQTTRNVWTKCYPFPESGLKGRVVDSGMRPCVPTVQHYQMQSLRQGGANAVSMTSSQIDGTLPHTNHYFTKMPLKPKVPIKTLNKTIIT